jgi:hypothetical protein
MLVVEVASHEGGVGGPDVLVADGGETLFAPASPFTVAAQLRWAASQSSMRPGVCWRVTRSIQKRSRARLSGWSSGAGRSPWPRSQRSKAPSGRGDHPVHLPRAPSGPCYHMGHLPRAPSGPCYHMGHLPRGPLRPGLPPRPPPPLRRGGRRPDGGSFDSGRMPGIPVHGTRLCPSDRRFWARGSGSLSARQAGAPVRRTGGDPCTQKCHWSAVKGAIP